MADGPPAHCGRSGRLNPISNDGFRFTDAPGCVEAFTAGIATLAALPCDVLLTGHPGASGLFANVAARDHGIADALVNPNACKQLAAALQKSLDERVARERQRAAAQ